MTDGPHSLRPTERFGDRVDDYIASRPGYPSEICDVLKQRHAVAPEAVVADLGCGTGLLARVFLESGFEVTGVEPNAPMRHAGASELAGYEQFRMRVGTAEATGLRDDSIDLVVAGQAFHWFEPEAAARECRRILRPGSVAALIWNSRGEDSAFLLAYDAVLRSDGTDYEALQRSYDRDAALTRFFGHLPEPDVLPNPQYLDAEGLRRRVMSCSYIPPRGDPRLPPLLDAVDRLFREHQEDGRVRFDYRTEVFAAELGA